VDKINGEQLQGYLDEIISSQAFELHMISAKDAEKSCCIPYMMNDALECYLLLTDARMVGEYLPDYEGDTTARVTEHEESRGVIVRQGEGNVFTVWFRESFRVLNCYRYDQIGHFWVKGQEQWRRLVYIIGTIHDKYHYMGASLCNETECQLAALMGFGPLRYYSPIRESLDEYYEDSEEGLNTMEDLAEEAGDRRFVRFLYVYRWMLLGAWGPFRRGTLFYRWMTGVVAKAMNRMARMELYQLIERKVQKAAMEYPERRYQAELEDAVKKERDFVSRKLEDMGFSGVYPLFYKGTTQILAMEEHPFVVMESEQYHFRIQFMVSEARLSSGKINEGFFRKKGNRGWIAQNLEFLD